MNMVLKRIVKFLYFTILCIPNAIVIAFLITIFDILPVLGTGGIVIPWAIFLFIDGQVTLGFGLLMLYVIVTIVRNVVFEYIEVFYNNQGTHRSINYLSIKQFELVYNA